MLKKSVAFSLDLSEILDSAGNNICIIMINSGYFTRPVKKPFWGVGCSIWWGGGIQGRSAVGVGVR